MGPFFLLLGWADLRGEERRVSSYIDWTMVEMKKNTNVSLTSFLSV